MALYDDQLDPLGGTSIVAQEDPFLTWYHGAQAAEAPPLVPVDDPNEIQMPPQDARVQMGFPVDPGPRLDQDAAAAGVGEIEMPAEDARPGASSPPSAPPMGLQPGLGVPQGAFDAGAAQVAPLEVDAISGGDWRANVPTAPGGNEYQQPGPSGVELTPEQRAQMFRRSSPEDQARQLQAWTEQRDARERELRDRADLEQRQREVENHAAIQRSIGEARAATEKLNADAAKLAEQELDTSWKAGPGKRIAGIILGIVGGLVQSRQGGANQGLAIIDADLANQIEARKLKMANQRAELQRRGASIQQLLAFDMQQHEETVRYGIATYERAKSDIASQMQQYDPRGKTALQLGQTYAAIDQARAKALQEYEANYQKQWVKMYELDQEDRKIRVSEGELALKQAKAAGAGGAAKPKEDDVVYTPEQWAAMGVQGVAQPMSLKQLKKIQPLVKGGQDIVAGQSQGLSKEELERSVPGLKQPDGKPFVAVGTPEAIEKLRKQKAATESAIDLMDQALITRTGWSSDIGNSQERAQLRAIWGQAVMEVKDLFDLGAITKSDEGLIEGVLGTDDPSSWKDPTDSIKKARELLINRLNKNLKGHGYNGPRFDVRPLPPEGAKKKPGDDTMAELLRDERGLPAERIAAEVGATKEDLVGNQAGLWRKYMEAGGILPSHRKQIDAIAADIRSPDEAKRNLAVSRLSDIANKAQSTGVKKYAQQALTQVATPDAAAEVADPNAGKSVSFETVPPVLTPPKGPRR